MVYMVQYDSTHGKFHGTLKAENGKLVIHAKAIASSRSKILPTSIGEWGAMLVPSMCWSHLMGGAKRLIISADVPCL